ncbi:hypothetical protein ACOSP7_004610 [Xanthoceras sorbifolium]
MYLTFGSLETNRDTKNLSSGKDLKSIYYMRGTKLKTMQKFLSQVRTLWKVKSKGLHADSFEFGLTMNPLQVVFRVW